MKLLNIERSELLEYICKQLNTFFPDKSSVTTETLKASFDTALNRAAYCFSHIKSKYFNKDDQTVFNYLNGDQYSMFLYFLSNSAYKCNLDKTICEKLFLLNKTLYGVDAYFEIELPEIFLFVHPMSTVLGRAQYANFFTVYQSCNIGSNHDVYPVFSEHVTMHPGSSVLGNCLIGKNCRLGAGALLLDHSIEGNKTYVGGPGNFKLFDNNDTNPIWV